MTGDPPTDGINSLTIADDRFMKALSLRFEEKKENKLGEGTFGNVYRGTFEVAVKVLKYHSDDARKKEQKREMEEHLRLDHENVLKLLHVDDSRDKTYLVLELCAGTLKDYCEEKYKGPMPPDGLVLYQIANGLHYIHSRKLVHRDVKPDNILISKTTPIQMKLSDFGFVKKTSPRGTFTQSGVKGTEKWMAPEILELMDNDKSSSELPHGTIQSDTFAAGCVFFCFLTRGKHPFGNNSYTVPYNILNKNPIELNQHEKNSQGLYKLIGKMIMPKEERISLPVVIERLTFLNSTLTLNGTGQFKKFDRSMSGIGPCVTRFHPMEPVLACGVDDKVILLSADNSFIPFSNWKEKETQLQPGDFEKPSTIEWNVNGTQLAAIFNVGDVIVWSYPSGEFLFQKTNFKELMIRIEWNPFRPNVFAILGGKVGSRKVVFFFNSCPIDQRPFHFYTIESEKRITSAQWISENRVALALWGSGGIEIWEIDETKTSAKLVKGLNHESVEGLIFDMTWNERTKCLAACSFDGWMTILSMGSDQPIHALQMRGAGKRINNTMIDSHCLSLAWRPNGKQTDGAGVDAARKSADNFILARGLDNGRIVIWTPLQKEKTRILDRHSHWVHSLSFSNDGQFLASADLNGEMIIWATKNWKPVYIGKREIRWVDRFSWLSSSTDFPDCKLAFKSYGGKVEVVEYAVDHSEKPSND